LCGQLLCFFKEQEDFAESKAAASPLNLYQAVCERASNYTKRKNVFRLRTSDGAEFLFSAEDQQHLDDWVKKISFHASLSPAQQLMSYDTYQVRKTKEKAFRWSMSLLGYFSPIASNTQVDS
jgi:spectrin beta